QFDGEDNVNIFEQLLHPPGAPATPAPGVSPNPGGAAALPAAPAPALAAVEAALALEAADVAKRVEVTPTWSDRLAAFGMGLLLSVGFFANLALAPVLGQPVAPATPRTKPRGKKRKS